MEARGTKDLLDHIADERVFEIAHSMKDSKFRIYEACDHWFYVELTPEELRQLGQEIIQLATDISWIDLDLVR